MQTTLIWHIRYRPPWPKLGYIYIYLVWIPHSCLAHIQAPYLSGKKTASFFIHCQTLSFFSSHSKMGPHIIKPQILAAHQIFQQSPLGMRSMPTLQPLVSPSLPSPLIDPRLLTSATNSTSPILPKPSVKQYSIHVLPKQMPTTSEFGHGVLPVTLRPGIPAVQRKKNTVIARQRALEFKKKE